MRHRPLPQNAALALSLLVAALLACSPPSGGPHDARGEEPAATNSGIPAKDRGKTADREALRRLTDTYVRAVETQDADLAASLWAADGVLIPADQPTVRGREAIRRYYAATWAKAAPVKVAVRSRQTRMLDGWALERGSFTFSGNDPSTGEPFRGSGRYLAILQRQDDGTWAVYWEMDNGVPLPAEPEPPEPAAGAEASPPSDG